MKINKDFIDKIYQNKIELKKKQDKIKLSNYSDYLPMYDIYSKRIYFIKNENVHYRLIDCHYRFINIEVKNWIKNQLDKEKNEDTKSILKNNLKIIDNYDLDTLEETSYKTLYKFSPELGLSISICKRKSFHPYISHLKPYYTKNELIKLGQNMGIIKNMDQKKLVDKELHYKICKKISNNDISRDLIKKFNQYIIENDCISWICYYSFTGSYLMNDFLRFDKLMDKNNYDGINKIVSVMKNGPKLENDYFFYRFTWDDDFLKNIKIGGTFVDKGFLSATRDPFYSPGIKQEFGFILIKINVPKNLEGIGLFIENFSLFPKEEEFLIPPNTKLKLISKDEKFKYYHTNNEFEKRIVKKYEFELVKPDFNAIKKIKYINEEIPTISFNIEYNEDDIFSIINQFNKNTDDFKQFKVMSENNEYIFNYQWFDSTNTYSKYYYHDIKDGLLFTCYENGYPIIAIECGNEMVVNYLNKFYYGNNFRELDEEEILYIVSFFAKTFKYKEVKIFPKYKNFSNFDYKIEDSDLLYSSMYCDTLYQYIKSNKTFFENSNLEYNYGKWKLDKCMNKKINNEVSNRLPEELKNKTWKNLIIEIVENHFYLYNRLEEWLEYYEEKLISNNYLIFDVKSYLRKKNIDFNIPLDFEYSKEKVKSEEFKKIFRSNIERII